MNWELNLYGEDVARMGNMCAVVYRSVKDLYTWHVESTDIKGRRVLLHIHQDLGRSNCKQQAEEFINSVHHT